MNEVRRGCRACALAMLLVLASMAERPAAAQALRPGDWDAALELLFDFSSFESDSPNSSTSVERTRTEQRLTLRNTNTYLYDPRFFTLTFGATIGLSQQPSTTEAAGVATDLERDGTLRGYDLSASLFQGQALSLSAFANRNESILTRELAGQTDVETASRGVTLFAKRLFLPSTVTFRRDDNDEQSSTGSVVTRRRERRETLGYEGRRGWIDSEMVLRYTRLDKRDETRPALDYRTDDGLFVYSRDLGVERNRRWDSRVRALRREGFTEEERLDVDQLLAVEHGPRLRSSYRYSLQRTDRPRGRTTRHTGVVGASHQFYDSLTTDVELNAVAEEQPGGNKDVARGRVNFGYTKRLPGDGRVVSGVGWDFTRQEDRFVAADSTALGESHTFAVPLALPIALDQRLVLASSIEVVKVASGPQVPGCGAFSLPRPLEPGVDYTVNTFGDITEIVPIPCTATTPGINPGDTITVDYGFRASPDLTFTTSSWNVSLALDYGWIRPFVTHREQDQDLVEGRDGEFLDDQQSDVVGLELKGNAWSMRGRLVAQAERFRSGQRAYESLRGNQTLLYRGPLGIDLALQGEQIWTDYSLPRDRRTEVGTARLTVTYPFSANLFGAAFAGLRDLRDTLIVDERIVEVGADLRWIRGLLEVAASLKLIDRERGSTSTEDIRATLRLVRRF